MCAKHNTTIVLDKMQKKRGACLCVVVENDVFWHMVFTKK